MTNHRIALLPVVIVASAAMFVACGPTNQMKTIKNKGKSFTTPTKDLTDTLDDKIKNKIAELQAETESKINEPIIIEIPTDSIMRDNYEVTENTANISADKPEDVGPFQETSTSLTLDLPSDNNGTPSNSILEVNSGTKELVSMINDIKLGPNTLELSYIDYEGKPATKKLTKNFQLSNDNETIFTSAVINEGTSYALNLEFKTFSSSKEDGNKLTVIQIISKTPNKQASALAFIKEDFAKLHGNYTRDDELLNILKRSQLKVIRSHFVLATKNPNGATNITEISGSRFNKVTVLGTEAGKESFTITLKTESLGTTDFFKDTLISLGKFKLEDGSEQEIKLKIQDNVILDNDRTKTEVIFTGSNENTDSSENSALNSNKDTIFSTKEDK